MVDYQGAEIMLRISTRNKLRIARIIYRMLRIFGFRQKRVVERNGIRFDLDLAEGIDLSIFLVGRFQRHLFDQRRIHLPDDALVMDVGANIGSITLPLAQIVKNGKVFAFEPTHYAFGKLKRNLELNPELCQRVEAIQTFVSDRDYEEAGVRVTSSWRLDSIEGDVHPVHGGLHKECVSQHLRLDTFVADRKLQRVDLIKIDTDGHEWAVLSGAKETIRKFRPVVLFELALYLLEENHVSYEMIETYFSGLGYRLMSAESGQSISSATVLSMVPKNGSLDVIALPQS